MIKHVIDVSEDELLILGSKVLELLIADKTTGGNIIWATEDYSHLGDEYHKNNEIQISLITGDNSKIIQPRVSKEISIQNTRQRKKGEVFTPAWVCNEQNNMIDDQWFGRSGMFNFSKTKSWRVNNKKILFDAKKGKSWKDYVDEKRLEVTCGEAPYITSRYDMATGKYIPIKRRIGLLDRKFRVVEENVRGEKEWIKWALRALESIYAFEYQGDSLLIARENILYSFIESCELSLNRTPTLDELRRAANIISWNVWQMDGMSCTVPDYKECEYKNAECIIHDWRSKKTIKYSSLINGVRE